MTQFADDVEAYQTRLTVGYAIRDQISTDVGNALTHWFAAQDHAAILDIIYALQKVGGYVADLYYPNYGGAGIFAMTHILRSCWEYDTEEMPGGEVTWQQIVEAWVTGDFEGRAYTIATIDRMRQLIWDEPFNVRWAARPEGEPP